MVNDTVAKVLENMVECIDILINNAGTGAAVLWKILLMNNFKARWTLICLAPLLLLSRQKQAMIPAGYGRIIIIARCMV